MKFLVVLLTLSSVKGWGALFNRFNPAMVPEAQKTGSYYNLFTDSKHMVEEPKVLARKIEKNLPTEVQQLEEEICFEKKCTSNENCCEGSVCIDIDIKSMGTCMPLYGRREGEMCIRDSDCEAGYICAEGSVGMRCQELTPGAGRFGDDCEDSVDCNIYLGLCCRLHRRQKMQPKKLCTYFTSPDVCIGPVAHHKVRRTIEYTANEKRRSPHPDHEFFNF